ncbi:MAG: rhomboid family intramembrane serine protease [Bacteroidales bacterium]|nr:rhomboid family intramembrane serine protease [Bacteroidales bacterium]MDZ4204357.1 rhomboid family intramembrane serine protease [Bacteroidales bacterium]
MINTGQSFNESDKEKSHLISSALWPVLFVLLLWLIKGFEELSRLSLSEFGLAPKSLSGILGILTYPFLHKDLPHLTSNSIPMLVLGTALFYYYRQSGITIFLQMFFISGFWLWVVGAQGSIHIGASGLVYGLAAFHLATGVFKRNARQMAFAVLVVFLYGSLVWGIFPHLFPNRNISWEGHLMGMIAGVILAWYHRDKGPQHDRYAWEDEEDAPTPLSINDESEHTDSEEQEIDPWASYEAGVEIKEDIKKDNTNLTGNPSLYSMSDSILPKQNL